jgi:two-component system chemotaxis response regulator CheY
MKVLVVDDDVVSRMVLMHMIDSCGDFDIVEADNGADAWAQMEGGLRPEICFCDLRMPRLSGMDLLLRVKRHAALNTMPFVLVSSAADQATVAQAADSGAAGYVVKPFQAGQVRGHLDALLEQRGGAVGAVSGAVAGQPLAAELPWDTLHRLNINAERLLVYLSGLQSQVAAAEAELDAPFADGGRGEAQARFERLHAGCVMLGLHGVAAVLKDIGPGAAALRAALAAVTRAVTGQAELLLRQDD